MSTPTHQKKRARTTGTNAPNNTVATPTATTNNATIQMQNLVTTQMNDVKLSQFTNIQREQQYQLEILRTDNTNPVKKNDELHLLADENKELRHELNQMKEKMDSKINEMKNEFKKQLDDLKKKETLAQDLVSWLLEMMSCLTPKAQLLKKFNQESQQSIM